MARKNLQEATVSDAESEARLAENRRAQAENELLIFAEDKKRVVAETEELEDEIVDLKKKKAKAKDELEVLQKKVYDQSILATERAAKMRDEEEFRQKTLADLDARIVEKSKEKAVLSDDVAQAQIRKTSIDNDIRTLESNRAIATEKSQEIEWEIVNKKAELNNIELAILDRSGAVDSLEARRRVVEQELLTMDKDIADKKSQIADLSAEAETIKRDIARVYSEKDDVVAQLKVKKDELEGVTAATSERLSIASVAEARVQQKLEFALRIIEKAKVDKLLSPDFKI